MESHSRLSAAQSLPEDSTQDDKRFITINNNMAFSDTQISTAGTERPATPPQQTATSVTDQSSTPPHQQQSPENRRRWSVGTSILKHRSSDRPHSPEEHDSPSAPGGRRKVRFSSVELHLLDGEDRPQRRSTVSPPPDRMAAFDDGNELIARDQIEVDDVDETSYIHSSPGVTANVDSEGYDPDGDIDPLSPLATGDSEGYDPNADVDPPSPPTTIENQDHTTASQQQKPTEGSTSSALKNVFEFGKAPVDAPSEGVTVVGKFSMDMFTGLSAQDVRVLDSEGYDPDADIDPPSDDEGAGIDELSDNGDEECNTINANSAPPDLSKSSERKISIAVSSTLPSTEGPNKTTMPDPPRRNAPSIPKAMDQAANKTAGTPLPTASNPSSIHVQKLATESPITPFSFGTSTTQVSFPHTKATDDLIRTLRSSGHSLSSIATHVNSHLATENLTSRIDCNGIYSRLVMLKHLHGSNDADEGMRGRTNTRQSSLFVAPRGSSPGSDGKMGISCAVPAAPSQTGDIASKRVQIKNVGFSQRDDEVLIRIYEEKCARFWDEIAEEMEKETGRRFEKKDLEERRAAL